MNFLHVEPFAIICIKHHYSFLNKPELLKTSTALYLCINIFFLGVYTPLYWAIYLPVYTTYEQPIYLDSE